MNLTRESVRKMAEELQAHLDGVGKAMGCKITVGNGTFGSTAVFKVELAPLGEDGEAASREGDNFKALARTYGLDPADLGREFPFGNTFYRLTGANPRCTSKPLLACNRQGKTYKFSTSAVRAALGY